MQHIAKDTAVASPSDTSCKMLTDPSLNAVAVSTQHKSDVYSRLSDPKSYTGVSKKRFETDRSERVVHEVPNAMRIRLNDDASRQNWTDSSSCTSTSAVSSVPVLLKGAMPTPEILQGDPNDPHTLLTAVFHYYCRFGRTGAKGIGEKTLDNANFVKLCRDCPDLLGPTLSKTDVDLIFVKCKKKGERRINYTRFLDALGLIAVQKYRDMPLETSMSKILEAHLAFLPCLLEFTDGKTVQAVWLKRAEYNESSMATTSRSLSPSV